MNKGFFIIQRELCERALSISPNVCTLYITLTRLANYGESQVYHGGQMITLHPGQLVTSLDHLSFQTGLTRSELRRALKQASNAHLIRTKRAQDGTLVSICNWEEIQMLQNTAPTQPEHQTESKEAIQETINKNQETNTCANSDKPEGIAQQIEAALEQSYDELYPRKVGRAEGIARLKKKIKTQKALEHYLACLQNYAYFVVDNNYSEKYIMRFSSFANRYKEFEDYVSPSTVPWGA